MNQKTTKYQILTPILLASFLVFGIIIGQYIVPAQGPKNNLLTIYPQSNKIESILNLIEEEYVDSIDKDEMVEELIPQVLKNLDPHTVYIPAKDLQEVNEELEGNFGGIGVQFSIQDDTVYVVSVISGGPSEKVGILPGDKIITVNDSLLSRPSVSNRIVMKKLRGEMGTNVTIGVQRRNNNDLINFDITRGSIPLYSVDVSYMINKTTGYIKVSRFARTTYQEFVTAIAKLKASNCQEFIIDLRGNSGGYLDIAIAMCNEFLGKDELIVYTQGKSKPRQDVYADGTGSCQNSKVTVLIDEFSASASEIFAGAIQDNDRGTIIGRRSFGKGLVQQQLPLNDGSALRLTIARYYTPSGRCIQKPYENGIEDYYHDIAQRYENGEFFEADSIHFSDSLSYKTRKGRIVYGGGGIMPDKFVPRDTTLLTAYYYNLRESGSINKFALQYANTNRDLLSKYTTAQEIETYLQNNLKIDDFLKFASKEKVTFNAKQYRKSAVVITVELQAYIARNILDNEGFYPIISQIDEILKTALDKGLQ